MALSDDSRKILDWLREQYVKAGYPNHKVWTFSPLPPHRAVFSELRAHGHIEPFGLGNVEWRLTDLGQQMLLQAPKPGCDGASRNHQTESASMRTKKANGLDHDEILLLREAIISARLSGSRGALLAHIPPEFVATLPIAPAPGDQVLMDLDALNRAGALADGSIPLITWLKNAAASSGGRQEGKVFEKALARCEGARSTNLGQASGSGAEPSGTGSSIIHHYHGDVHMGSTFNNNFSNNKIGAFGQGDGITVNGSLTDGAAGPPTQAEHIENIKAAKKALVDDEEQLGPLVSEALGQFLRMAREVQVEQKSLAEVQAKMKETLDEVWAQQAAKGLRPQALPEGLKVIEALVKSPITAELAKHLLAGG